MKIRELPREQDEQQMTAFYIGLSDLMVLLLVFFLLLLSMSKIETGSFEKIRSGFTGSTKGTLVELTSQLKEIIEGEPGVPGVKVHLAEDGVRLDLDTAALFNSGSATLKPLALDPLLKLLNIIRKTDYKVDVEGHSDDLPLRRILNIEGETNLETNWSLSGRRASSVIHHLLGLGFQESRIRLVGYASNHPIQEIAAKQGEELNEARAMNRRVSLLVK